MEVSFYFFQIFHNWWWIFFPFISFFLFRFFYLWWIRWEVFYKKFKWILLEIKPPREVVKPFSAMENVFSMLWAVWDDPNWRERWCKGAFVPGAGGWFSIEICSFGGEIHFYLRIPSGFRNAAESALYSQYPEVEIFEVEDYTQKVPKNIPNEKWDLYAEDYTLAKDDFYPIKTYPMFFEKPEEEKRVIEEKRIDPLDALLEQLSKFQSGEQTWIQIVCCPVTDAQVPFNWIKEGRAMADKIAKRKSPSPPKNLFQEIIETFFPGSAKKEEKPSMELIAPELRLTPGEKEILAGIENKIKKSSFQCWIKQVYIYKKDEPYTPGNYLLFRQYITQQLGLQNMNMIVFFGATRTRIHYWIKDRRLYLRKRQRFKEAIERLPSFFPWNHVGNPPPLIKFLTRFGYRLPPGKKSTCILNPEELATIFHFPAKIKVPTIARIEAKKGGPPPELPIK